MKKFFVAAVALAAWVSEGVGGIAVNWTAGGKVYGPDAGSGIAAETVAIWQLIYAGEDEMANEVSVSEDGWVSGDDVVLATRVVPVGGGTADDGTEWDGELTKLGGNSVFADVGWTGAGRYVFQRIYQATPQAGTPYFESGLFQINAGYAGGPDFPDMFGAAAGVESGVVHANRLIEAEVSWLSLAEIKRTFSADAVGENALGVNANVEWTAVSSVAWLTLKTESGSGNGTITYDVAANMMANSRSGTITVEGGGLSRTFTVVQDAAAPILELGEDCWNCTADTTRGPTLGVVANVEWTVRTDAVWLTVAEASGSGYGIIIFYVEANLSTEPRTGTITLAGGGLTRTFTVVQEGAAPMLALREGCRDFTPEAASGQTLEVVANVPWTAQSRESWLSVVTESGSGNGVLTYDVAANTATNSRSGTITVEGGGLTQTFTVMQEGVVVALEEDSRGFTAAAARGQTLAVEANVPWTAQSSAWWLTVKTESGSGNGTITYNLAANTGANSRTGTITVTGSGLTRTFTATQNGTAVTVENVTAKQRFPWNGLVDITCTVAGLAEGEVRWFAVEAMDGDSGIVSEVSHVRIVRTGTNSPNLEVSVNGDYHLVWDAQTELGAVRCSNMLVRVTTSGQDQVQLWEGGPYWADRNLGAEEPWEYGLYFWWGDTVGYRREGNAWVVSDGSAENFEFWSGNTPTYGKNDATLQCEGWITAAGVLAPEHDAAQVYWGGRWRMPTDSELSSLDYNCDWTWTAMNGVNGYVVRGRGEFAEASIFLPAAGYGTGASLYYEGSDGRVWSGDPDSDGSYAWCLYFNSGSRYDYYKYRSFGFSVRPVRGSAETACTVDSAPFVLDTVATTAEPCIANALPVFWNAEWIGGDTNATVVITDKGTEVKRATGAGELDWDLPGIGRHELTYTTYIDGRAQEEIYSATVYARWKYEVEGGKATIVETTQRSGDVAIPAEIDGYPVSSIGGGVFSGCGGLTAVSIPDSVTSIADGAFVGCNGLRSVAVPQSVCSGRFSAVFPDAYSLITNAVINAGVESIGAETFAGCASLAAVDIPESVMSIGERAFSGCSSMEAVNLPAGMTGIAEGTFNGCSRLASVSIPDGVASIGADAFAGCSGLRAVYIRDLATWMGISFGNGAANPLACAHHLFTGAAEVTDLLLPAGVEAIKAWTFNGCSGLRSVSLPDSLEWIGTGAFAGCDGIRSVALPQSVCSGRLSDVFPAAYGRITNAVINAGVDSIGWEAFAGCASLAAVNIPESVTSIGARAFSGCSSLKTVSLPSGLTSIAGGTFNGCSGLSSVRIPDGVVGIGADAFAGCNGLTAVYIRDLPTWLGISFGNGAANPLGCAHHLYAGGAGVTDLVIPAGVETVKAWAFNGCTGLRSVSLPNHVSIIGDGAFAGCDGIRSVAIPQKVCNRRLSEVFPAAYSSITDVTINEGVTSIAAGAFAGCTGMRTVKIPDSMTGIGDSAFADCGNLVSVLVGNGVKDIGWLAGKSRLEEVIFGDGVTEVGDGTFAACKGLRIVSMGNGVRDIGWLAGHTNLERVAIGSGVREIGIRPFAGCGKLASLTLSEGLECIVDDAFGDCVALGWVELPTTLVDWGLRSLPPPMRARLGYGEDGFMVLNGWVLGHRDTNAPALSLPDGVAGIGNHALADFWELGTVEMPVSLRYIGRGAFETNTYLDNVVIPDGVEWVRDGAFQGCTYMRDLRIGESVGHIGREAFARCTQLATVTVPDSVSEIGDGAFSGCRRMLSVKLPLGLESPGTGMFDGCNALTGVTMPAHGFTAARLFEERYAALEAVTVAGEETVVCAHAFKGCSSLASVSLPEGVEEIGSGAFRDCRSLEEVELPEGVASIGDGAFQGCSSLGAIVLPDSVSAMGTGVFRYCTGLKNVTLSRGMATVPDYSFEGCTGLASLVVPASVTNLGTGIGEWLTAVYCLGNAPGYSWATYNSRSADVTTYVVRGTRGWDGIASSRDLPEEWIGWPITFWEPNRFDATFDANGGKFPDGAATYACEQITGVAYALPPYEPVLDGAVFDGWWTDPAEGAPIKATTQVNETRDIRFYAHWKGAPAAVTVRFNANGGTVEPTQGTYYATLTYGELPVPTREHYLFTGWWTAANGGNKVVVSSRVPSANQELFAHWTPETYVIRFHANGGEGTMADQTFTYGSPVTLRANAFRREGWDFAGWATSADGAAVYADKSSFSEVSAIQDGIIHLYAIWSNGGYAVRFDANGGTGRMDNQTFRFGIVQALSPNQFSRGRFRFLGWTLAPLGGVVYADGAEVRDLTTTPGASVVLYAVWELPAIAEDAGVADVLEGSPDRRLKAKVTTAEAYAGFREWALGVKGPDGGVASANAVLASEHAWASYALGAEALFGNEPEIRLEGVAMGPQGRARDAGAGTVTVRVAVFDGGEAAAVDAVKVAGLFAATGDMGDWVGTARLELSAEVVGMDADGCMTFAVTAGEGTERSAFFGIRE